MKHVRRVLALVLLVMMVATMASAEVNADVSDLTSMDQLDQILASSGLYYGDLGTMKDTDAVESAVQSFPDFEELKAKCKSCASSPYQDNFLIATCYVSGNTGYVDLIFQGDDYFIGAEPRYGIRDRLNDPQGVDSHIVTKGLPETGDETPVVLLCVLLAGAAAGIIALRRRQAKLMG